MVKRYHRLSVKAVITIQNKFKKLKKLIYNILLYYKSMVKKTNTNSNFNIGNDVRNRQIAEIINEERNANQRVFNLEKQEYTVVYPDPSNRLQPAELPPQVKYQFALE